jgi:hypothetical protein
LVVGVSGKPLSAEQRKKRARFVRFLNLRRTYLLKTSCRPARSIGSGIIRCRRLKLAPDETVKLAKLVSRIERWAAKRIAVPEAIGCK